MATSDSFFSECKQAQALKILDNHMVNSASCNMGTVVKRCLVKVHMHSYDLTVAIY